MTHHALKHEGKILQSILNKVGELQQLQQHFVHYLDPELAKHCRVAKLDKDCLIVLVDNGNWATQLRFYIPDLLVKLRNHPPLENLKAICSKIRPDYQPVKAKKSKKSLKKISEKTLTILMETSNTIKDEKIRQLMKKIIDHLEPY